MITVPFIVDAHDVKNSNELSVFLQQFKNMPWLTYLIENSKNVMSEKYYQPAQHQYIVEFRFEMDPKKETYYRLKYGNGT